MIQTNNRVFFIKKESTYPLIEYPLTQSVREKYRISEDMLENCAITFSMMNSENGKFVVANSEAFIKINDRLSGLEKYILYYRFEESETSKIGIYLGEFVVDFLGDFKIKMRFPMNDYINIYIQDSITRTTVI